MEAEFSFEDLVPVLVRPPTPHLARGAGGVRVKVRDLRLLLAPDRFLLQHQQRGDVKFHK